ncbi:uncharacterized protein LOC128882775 [Hylaeus volcanicus]|uniref:uncharacterized protein LOC128882775 n=1 Tax=Hylaeus volcanicus TaxID=313075 RepID=UPI0023B7E07A|nr:uncharacterized protein LOC128882775 [Hylaeus volcanicus]
MIKTSWETKKIPQDWKEGRICFMNKPNKAALRPITLTSCTGKIMEKIINRRISMWAESSNKIDESQSGFRNRRSTTDNLNRVVSEIKYNRLKNKDTVTAFVDIKSPYDNVNLGTLIDILMELGCPRKIVRWIKEWLKQIEGLISRTVMG